MKSKGRIDELYKYYLDNWSFEIDPNDGSVCNIDPIKVKPHTKEQFEYRLKTDPYFSGRWDSRGTVYVGPFSPRIAKAFLEAEKDYQKNKQNGK